MTITIMKRHFMRIGEHVIHLLCLLGLWLGLGLQAHAQSDTVTYIYTDPQGTPLVEADAQGNVIARYDYSPYGTPVAALGNPPDGPGYTGHVRDPETGLVYMQARYYQPIGLFLSPDPVGPTPGNVYSFNRYAYADNNPIANVDPDGQSCADGQDGPDAPCNPSPPPPTPNPTLPKNVTPLPAVTVTATVAKVVTDAVEVSGPSLFALRAATGVGLYFVDANGFHDMLYGKQGCYGALECDGNVVIPLVHQAVPLKGSKPKNAPPGTIPIDRYPGLSKDDIHTIKDGVGAGPQDWTGIAPNGDVITGDHEGNAINNGSKGDYLPGGE